MTQPHRLDYPRTMCTVAHLLIRLSKQHPLSLHSVSLHLLLALLLLLFLRGQLLILEYEVEVAGPCVFHVRHLSLQPLILRQQLTQHVHLAITTTAASSLPLLCLAVLLLGPAPRLVHAPPLL